MRCLVYSAYNKKPELFWFARKDAMKNLATFLGFCLLVLGPSVSCAQAPASNEGRIPPILIEGLRQLANQIPEEAVKSWFHGSQMEGHTDPGLRQILERSGKYENFDVVSVQDLTPRLRVLYLALNFEKEPIIVKFVVYKTPDGWILLSYRLGLDEANFETVPSAH